MVNPKVFWVTDVNESVVAAPAIGMNDGFDTDMPADNGLELFSLDIRYDLGEYLQNT